MLGAWRVQADVRVRAIGACGGQGLGDLGKIGGGEDRHPGELSRRGGVDRDDARPRVRRPHEGYVDEPGRHDVVDEPTAPGEETRVFLAPRRLTDHGRRYTGCLSRSGVNGSARSRLPVALAIPLAMAAAVGPCAPSPTPRNRSAGWLSSTTSTSGTSAKRT